jgi:hypothetical protein
MMFIGAPSGFCGVLLNYLLLSDISSYFNPEKGGVFRKTIFSGGADG